MPIINKGIKVVFGVRERKPISCVPIGRTKLVMKNNDIAKLFVKTKTGIRVFILEDLGDTWLAKETLLRRITERIIRRIAYLPRADVSKCFSLNPSLLN